MAAGLELVEKRRTPGRARLITDRSLRLPCQVLRGAWLKCFHPVSEKLWGGEEEGGVFGLEKKEGRKEKTSLCPLLISKCQNLNLKRSRTLSKSLGDGLNGRPRQAVGKVFTHFILFFFSFPHPAVMASPFVSLIGMDLAQGRGRWGTSAGHNEAETVSWGAILSASLRIRPVVGGRGGGCCELIRSVRHHTKALRWISISLCLIHCELTDIIHLVSDTIRRRGGKKNHSSWHRRGISFFCREELRARVLLDGRSRMVCSQIR